MAEIVDGGMVKNASIPSQLSTLDSRVITNIYVECARNQMVEVEGTRKVASKYDTGGGFIQCKTYFALLATSYTTAGGQ